MTDPHADIPADLPTRSFGWSDMFLKPEDDPRSDGGFDDERSLLVGYLRDHRLTLELKCADLDAEALARRSVPPSTMSLLGLVRHMAEVERGWFRRTMAGEDAPRIWCTEEEPDADFDGAVADPKVVEEAWAAWRAEVAYAERFVDEAADLGVKGHRGDLTISLRELLVHMIEEYARHNGHADFLRERIDGRVGQ
ncbi:putative damage-inducible protein DinB [Micromonospora sp. A200]|uniref:DinB family protein n=1 Tax=Micromonospora sp. A200 TaxID=2940568 RepID=UPI002475FC67|nr:DinB family protein [Micromonospora sp. A200]MDH6462156.1 putative damage-inducible protein DinB [Micromonospora sp. A200]